VKRLLLLTLPVVALVAACRPTKTPPPRSEAEREIAECEAGFDETQTIRPDVTGIVPHECVDLAVDDDPNTRPTDNGVYYPPPRNFWRVNIHDPAVVGHEYGERHAHENGHAWRFNFVTDAQRDRLLTIIGFDPATPSREEIYAEVFRFVVFEDAFGGLVVTPEQEAAICAERLVPCAPEVQPTAPPTQPPPTQPSVVPPGLAAAPPGAAAARAGAPAAPPARQAPAAAAVTAAPRVTG
jgi:hypothetical protein